MHADCTPVEQGQVQGQRGAVQLDDTVVAERGIEDDTATRSCEDMTVMVIVEKDFRNELDQPASVSRKTPLVADAGVEPHRPAIAVELVAAAARSLVEELGTRLNRHRAGDEVGCDPVQAQGAFFDQEITAFLLVVGMEVDLIRARPVEEKISVIAEERTLTAELARRSFQRKGARVDE